MKKVETFTVSVGNDNPSEHWGLTAAWLASWKLAQQQDYFKSSGRPVTIRDRESRAEIALIDSCEREQNGSLWRTSDQFSKYIVHVEDMFNTHGDGTYLYSNRENVHCPAPATFFRAEFGLTYYQRCTEEIQWRCDPSLWGDDDKLYLSGPWRLDVLEIRALEYDTLTGIGAGIILSFRKFFGGN